TTYINPLYADVITEDDLVQPSEDEGDVTVSAASTTYYTTSEEVAEQLRAGMKNRTETIEIAYKTGTELTEETFNELFNEILSLTLEHTGAPEEGDYLAYQYGTINVGAGGYSDGNSCFYTLTFTVTYYTDAEQEAEVTEKVAEVLDELGVDGMSDYDKIEAIYDYICTHVVYDYEDLSNSDEVLEYTAYNALINGTAVCQGYAVLFYRMALEAGVDARIVSGTGTNSEGTTKAHAWDIVKLGGCYYNVDATWDESSYLAGIDYRYFLLSEASFSTNHFRGAEYTTDEFYAAYPMASCDYTESIDLSTCTATVASAIYTGEALTPPVTVKNPAGSTLLLDTDYTVSYEGDLVNIGSYTITIIGQGNYTGAITETFTITKADMTVKATNYTGSYDGSAHTFTLTVSGPSSYTVYYSTSTELTSSNYSTSGTTTKPTRT
ncbi:MAG: hypothetical protein LUC35_08240, partial [Clostridiales bacterium]|nr:hypothetical protein [Clostridiales bacterium]